MLYPNSYSSVKFNCKENRLGIREKTVIKLKMLARMINKIPNIFFMFLFISVKIEKAIRVKSL